MLTLAAPTWGSSLRLEDDAFSDEIGILWAREPGAVALLEATLSQPEGADRRGRAASRRVRLGSSSGCDTRVHTGNHPY